MDLKYGGCTGLPSFISKKLDSTSTNFFCCSKVLYILAYLAPWFHFPFHKSTVLLLLHNGVIPSQVLLGLSIWQCTLRSFKSFIRHEDFLCLFVCSDSGRFVLPPLEIWNRLDCTALVESRPPNIETKKIAFFGRKTIKYIFFQWFSETFPDLFSNDWAGLESSGQIV